MLYNEIIKLIEKVINGIILLSDPDRLLSNEKVLFTLEKNNYKIIYYKDPILFRYEYEEQYRIPIIEGNPPDYRLIIYHEDEVENLPFDIQKEGHSISLSLSQFFPGLDMKVIRELDVTQREELFSIHSSSDYLGERATVEYMLKKLFKIDTSIIKTPLDLFIYLIRRHYKEESITPLIDEYLLTLFLENHNFQSIPVREILSSKEEFFKYLQKEWKIFIESHVNKGISSSVPFNNKDIKVYIDDLFIEGLLDPVIFDSSGKIPPWARIGVIIDGKTQDKERILKLFETISQDLPDENQNYKEWMKFSGKWAEFIKIYHQIGNSLNEEEINEIENFYDSVEKKFHQWLECRYSRLITLPYLPSPVMVHHIPEYLSSIVKKGEKVALIIIDGMAVDQWISIREFLMKNHDRVIKENKVFAWIPTLTSVSRQAILSGQIPERFKESINTTNKEEKLWNKFWENEGLDKKDIGFKGNLNLMKVDFPPEYEKFRVLALIVTKLDEILHSITIGPGQIYKDIDHWLENGILKSCVEEILSSGFIIYITSDHGNIYSTGTGRVKSGSLADKKGQRVCIFDTSNLRDITAKENVGIKWYSTGLPENYYPLIANRRKAFVTEGEKIVSHGGISLEEVIVPFIEIRRKT